MRRSFIRCMIAVLLTSSIGTASAAPRVTVTDAPDVVVVYVHDLDLLRGAHSSLVADVRLEGVDTAYRVDLAANYQLPAVLIRKRNPDACGKVTVTIRAGDEQIFSRDIDPGATVQSKVRISVTQTKAFIEPGKHMTAAPEILQPDLAGLQPLPLAEAERAVEMQAVAAKVQADMNFPLISANNNCAISRQTAYPDDPGRRSCYVPLKSQLYDPKTGNPSRVAHYLAEVPIDPAWATGTEDEVITLGVADIRTHTTDKRWPPGKPRSRYITGDGAGGLGQLVGSVAVDDAGNIYYSASMPSHIVRFNIAKAEFETPPIDIMTAMNEHLPAKDSIPGTLKAEGARWDHYMYVTVGEGRVVVSPVRYAHYGRIYCNGVFSFPIEHWYDAAEFRAGTRFVAGCWPGSPAALYKDWPKRRIAARKVAPGVVHDSKYYMTSYANGPGGPWSIDLAPDGSSRGVRIADRKEIQQAWRAASPKLRVRAGGFIHWWDYGVLTTTRTHISQALTGTPDAGAKGDLTIYYDVIGAMRRDPKRHAEILGNLRGPGLAPCYMAVEIPGKPGHILGVGEYGYYLADFDLTRARTGTVSKRFLKLDMGRATNELPVKIGLGPYGRLWWRDGDKQMLFMCGYTGIARLLYSVGGKPLERHDSVLLRLSFRSLDGAPGSGFKWSRYPVAGIDGRIYLTGRHSADRGGLPYSNGLQTFSAADPKELLRLSHMTRGCSTYLLRTRVLYNPNGRKLQQFVLAAGMSVPAYIAMMGESDLPENRSAKHFLYECREGEEPKDILGFSLPVVDGKSGVACQVLSRDRRYLVTLQHGCILSFDLATMQYVDGRKLGADVWEFSKPDFRFNTSPDDRIFICTQRKGEARATFHELEVSPEGAISLRPHLALTASTAAGLVPVSRASIAFVADPSGDGSYDLCMGPWWRRPGTRLWVIPDFLPPRLEQPQRR